MDLSFSLVIAGLLLILLSIAGTVVLILSGQVKQVKIEKAMLKEDLRQVQDQISSRDDIFHKLQLARDLHKANEERQSTELKQIREDLEALENQQREAEQRIQRLAQSNERLQDYNRELEEQVSELSESRQQLLASVRQLQVIRDRVTEERDSLQSRFASEILVERMRICSVISDALQQIEHETDPSNSDDSTDQQRHAA